MKVTRSSLGSFCDDLIAAQPLALCFSPPFLFLLCWFHSSFSSFSSSPPPLPLSLPPSVTLCVLSVVLPLELLCVCGCSTTLETLTCFPGVE